MLVPLQTLSLAVLLVSAAMATLAGPVPAGMATIPGGVYRPAFRSETDPKEVPVKAFALDVFPVTNGEFLEFVRANRRWQRSLVKRIFADESYLKSWAGDLELGTNAPQDVPVTFVSWFAAKAYAQWKDERLPTVAEWEYAASASATRPDGDRDAGFKRQLLEWYSTPASKLTPVSEGHKNYWGVADLHGLVWEWVADFSAAMVTGDSRTDSGLDKRLFCGAGAQNAADREDFAAFMRYGFRSSLKADYTVHNLGFRCAKDLNE
jgi:formylglycine-generating enzyme required for sulfatase activity